MNKSEKKFIIIIFVISLVIRLVYVATVKHELIFDARSFEWAGSNLVNHHKYFYVNEGAPVEKEPGYPVFIAVVYFLTGQKIINIRIAQSLVNSFTVILIFLIARKVFNKRTAYLSALIAVIYPFFIYDCGEILRETLYTFMLALSILCLLRAVEGFSVKKMIISGLCFGLTLLVKPTLIFLPGFVFIWLLFYRDKINLKKIIILTAAHVMIVAIVLLPWAIKNYKVYNIFTPLGFSGGGMLWLGNNPRATGYGRIYHDPEIYKNYENNSPEMDAAYRKKALEFMVKNPGRVVVLSFIKLYHMYKLMPVCNYYEGTNDRNRIISLLSYGLLFPFFIAGLFINLKNNRKVIILYIILLLNTLLHMILLGMVRYRLPTDPYIIMFASSAIIVIIDKAGIAFPEFTRED